MLKKILFSFGILAILSVGYYVYMVHFDYRFTEVTNGKVYSSGVIPPDEIESYVKKNGIKTIVDLRIGNIQDKLNPGRIEDIILEKEAVDKIEGVDHINIPSLQIPTDETLDKFFEVMSDSTVYPVLIHCYHGTGRAVLFSALYRIEYENFTPEEARQKSRLIVPFSNFDSNSPKGNFLINYKKRVETKDTIN